MSFFAKNWRDLVGLLALALTIWTSWRARSAARQARDVSLQVSERMSRFEAVEVISAAIAAMDEIMRVQRRQEWEPVGRLHTVLERYASVKLI